MCLLHMLTQCVCRAATMSGMGLLHRCARVQSPKEVATFASNATMARAQRPRIQQQSAKITLP